MLRIPSITLLFSLCIITALCTPENDSEGTQNAITPLNSKLGVSSAVNAATPSTYLQSNTIHHLYYQVQHTPPVPVILDSSGGSGDGIVQSNLDFEQYQHITHPEFHENVKNIKSGAVLTYICEGVLLCIGALVLITCVFKIWKLLIYRAEHGQRTSGVRDSTTRITPSTNFTVLPLSSSPPNSNTIPNLSQPLSANNNNVTINIAPETMRSPVQNSRAEVQEAANPFRHPGKPDPRPETPPPPYSEAVGQMSSDSDNFYRGVGDSNNSSSTP